MMYDGIITKPKMEDIIEHNDLIGIGLELYRRKNRKKKTDQQRAAERAARVRKTYNYTKKIGKDISNFAKYSVDTGIKGAKVAHKYIYKKLNKNGKVIYVYDTKGNRKLRKMTAIK